MPGSAMLKCPRATCGYALKREEVARLCPYCGEDLTALLAALDTGRAPSPVPASCPPAATAEDLPPRPVLNNVVVPSIPSFEIKTPPREKDEPTSVEPPPPPMPATLRVENPYAAAAASATDHGCPELLVEYNNALIFIVGCKLNFEFQVTPQVEGVSNVRIEIRDADKQEVIAAQNLDQRLEKDQREKLPMAFRPGEQHEGEMNCDITVSFAWQGSRLVYRARRKTHNVLRASDSAGKVLETLNVNLTQNLDKAHANDIRVYMDDFMGKLPQRGQYRINFEQVKLPPQWEPLHLSPSSARPTAARPLTLCFPMQRVHVLPESQVRIGRSRENELVARIPTVSREDNQRIHNFHCQIMRVENEVFIKDGGAYPDGFRASSNGTFVNGEQLAPESEYKVAPNKTVVLTLSDKDSNDRRVFGLKMRLWRRMDIQDGLSHTCGKGAPEEIVALTMQAMRDPQQWFVLLWRQFPMEKICGRDFGGVCLCKEPLGFLMQHAGVCDPLEPGRELDIGGQIVQIARYEKPWLSSVR